MFSFLKKTKINFTSFEQKKKESLIPKLKIASLYWTKVDVKWSSKCLCSDHLVCGPSLYYHIIVISIIITIIAVVIIIIITFVIFIIVKDYHRS